MLKADLAKAFLKTHAFQWDPNGGFTLASGIHSAYYVDCRALLAFPGPRHLAARLAFEAIQGLEIDCLGGLEIGAIAIATAISDYGLRTLPRREWRTFVVRKQPKDHGLGKLIEGAIQPGDRALIVDDVLTSGGSVLTALQATRQHGLTVTHVLVIVDREEHNARALVEAQGVTVLSLLTMGDLTKAREL